VLLWDRIETTADQMIDEDLIKYGLEEDVWFHADKLSSAHIYLRMNEGETWETIPEDVLTDCAQLTKANSIEGV
jgi:predicted ribosome quality control (RQC) complex YloA/Tae2 family protein